MVAAVRLGFLGCGVVGGAAIRIIQSRADELERRAGARLEVARVAVRSPDRPRGAAIPVERLTADARAVVGDPEIDVVVEVMGGTQPAGDLILHALATKKHVVTANKELLATNGGELMQAARDHGVDLLFEGAVAGGIPLIRPMKESLAGDQVRRVIGIVNGTTNFILSRMSETGAGFQEALAEAERLGYAESDPTADIQGHDAAAKLAILASIAFGAQVVASDVDAEGIGAVRPRDIEAAHELGYEVKLLAVAEEEDGAVSARVRPAMLPRTHPLSSVRDVFNAVFVEAAEAGELMFFGRGAGGSPTGSAVVGDIVEIARNITTGGRSPTSSFTGRRARMRHPLEVDARYYIVLAVLDQPGVLSEVAGVFAKHDVSIASVRQEGRGDEATLVLITHTATERQHRATFQDLAQLSVVGRIESTMRVEDAEHV